MCEEHRKEQEEKTHVAVSSSETAEILKGYLKYPASWSDIVKYVKRKRHTFTLAARKLYEMATEKSLKTRCQNVYSKLMIVKSEPENDEIRELLQSIKSQLKEETKKRKPTEMKMKSKEKQDPMENMKTSSDDENGNNEMALDDTAGPSHNTQAQAPTDERKTSAIVRENALLYNKMMMIPTLLAKVERALEGADEDN